MNLALAASKNSPQLHRENRLTARLVYHAP